MCLSPQDWYALRTRVGGKFTATPNYNRKPFLMRRWKQWSQHYRLGTYNTKCVSLGLYHKYERNPNNTNSKNFSSVHICLRQLILEQIMLRISMKKKPRNTGSRHSFMRHSCFAVWRLIMLGSCGGEGGMGVGMTRGTAGDIEGGEVVQVWRAAALAKGGEIFAPVVPPPP